MSTTVDNRVVKMTFDNAQFERNVKNTMKTLKDFEESLSMKGAAAGFDKVRNAINNVNFSALGDKLKDPQEKITSFKNSAIEDIGEISKSAENADFSAISNAALDAMVDTENAASNLDLSSINDATQEAAEGFNAMEAIALGALMRIGSQVEDFVMNKLRGLTRSITEPIIEGFKEYETQMGSIQTIMANTGLEFNSDEDIALVNDRLDELNAYADKTIYNFTEMTRNIGTFTAAGVDLDTATQAIQGIANMAALSGSTSQQASTAMYQLSQALAAGTLKLQDWNSVVNAGMGGKVFQEALKRTARAHGIAVDQIIADQGSFRESLQTGWISSEILTETLNQMAITYDRVGDEAYNAALEQLKNAGYAEEDAKEILKLAKAAEQSATKVRTWTQLWDTVKEAIGSSWSQIFRSIIGDFKEATDLFTFMSNNITGAVDTALGGLVQLAESFNLSGARAFLFGSYLYDENGDFLLNEEGQLQRTKGAIDNLFEAIKRPMTAIVDAFSEIFSFGDSVVETLDDVNTRIRFPGLEEDIAGFALSFKKFTSSLIISQDAMIGIHETFKGLFSVLDLGIRIVLDIAGAFFELVRVARIFINPLIDIALAIGGLVGNAFTDLRDMILITTNSFKTFVGIFNAQFGKGGVIGLLGVFVKTWMRVLDIPGKIRAVSDAITFFGNAIFNAFQIPEMFEEILNGNMFKEMTNKVLSFFGILEGEGTPIQRLREKVKSDFKDLSKTFSDAFPQVAKFFELFNGDTSEEAETKRKQYFKTVLDSITNIVGPLRSSLLSLGNSVGTIVSSAFDVLKSVLSALLPILQSVGSVVLGVVGFGFQVLVSTAVALFNVLSSIASVVANGVSTAFYGLSNAINVLLGPLQNLVGAFADFVKRMWEGFTSLEPVKNFIATVGGFFNTVGNIVTSLPERIGKMFGFMGNSAKEASSDFDPLQAALQWITDATEALNNMTFDDFVNNLQKMRDNIVGYFQSIVNYWANLDPYRLVTDLFLSLSRIRFNGFNFLDDIFSGIENAFPELNGSLTSWLKGVNTDLSTGLADVYKQVADIAKNSEGFPEFFGGIFQLISDNVKGGFQSILDSFNDFISKSPSGKFVAIADAIKGFIQPLFNMPIIGEPLRRAWNIIFQFFTDVTNGADNFGGVVSNIFSKLRGALENLPGNFGDAFKWLFGKFDEFKQFITTMFPDLIPTIQNGFGGIGKAILGGLSVVTGALSNLPGFFGEIFSNVHTFIDGLLSDGESAKDGVEDSFYKTNAALSSNTDETSNKMNGFFDIFDPSKIKEKLGNFGTTLKDKVEGIFNGVVEFLESVPEKIRHVIELILDCIPQEKIKELTDLAMGVIKARLFLALTTFVESVGTFIDSASRKFEPKETLADKVKKFAEVILMIAGAIWIVSTIKPEDCAKAVITLGIMSVVMVGIAKLFSKIPNSEDIGSGLLKSVLSLLVIAAALKALMIVFGELAEQDDQKMIEGKNRAVGIILVFGLLIAGLTKLTKQGDALKSAAGLLILAFAINKLVDAFIFIANQDEEQINKGRNISIAVVVIFGALITLLSKFAGGSNAIKVATSLVILAAAIGIMAIALTSMSGIPIGTLITSFVGLSVIMGIFLGLVNATKESDIHSTAMSMILFSASVGIMCLALTQLASMRWEQLLFGGAALGIMIGAFAALVYFTKESDLVASAAALVLFGGAIVVMSYGLSMLANLDMGMLITAGVVMGILIGVFGGLSIALANLPPAIPVMIAFAAGLISIGATAILMANAVVILAQSRQEIAEFAKIMGDNLGNFGAAALSFVALGGGLVVLGVGVGAFGIAAGVAAGGIALLNMALNSTLSIAERAQEFTTAGYNITAGLGQGIDGGLGLVTQSILGIGQGILQTILGFFGIASPSTVMADQVGQFLPAGIAQGITNNQGETDNSLGSMLSGLIERFTTWVQTEGLPKLQEFGSQMLEKLRTEILPNIQTWVTETGLPALGEMGKKVIDHLMEKLGELPGKLLEWAGTLPGKIWDGIQGAWSTITKIGSDIIQGIIDGITSVPSAIADAVIGMANDGLEGIKKFFGIASPSKLMKYAVGRFIPLGLAEGITEFSDVVSKAGRSMAEDTTKDINKGLSGIQSDFDINLGGYSNFTPVLDSSSLDSQIESYRSTLSGMNLSTSADVTQQIDASIDTTSLLTASQNQAANIEELYNQNAKLIAEVSRLREDMSRYTTAINNSAIVMDTGTLVGAIAPQIDGALGMRRTQSSRGVR